MKILVLSDSHSGLHYMRMAINAVKPDAAIHLGDYYDDAQTMMEEFPHLQFHLVPGNCDRYRVHTIVPEILSYRVCGVNLYMTHGHLHNVKMSLYSLLKDAAAAGAQAVLYGHTHIPQCEQAGDMWILNPGACGSSGGSVGLIETCDGKITACRILRQADLEALL